MLDLVKCILAHMTTMIRLTVCLFAWCFNFNIQWHISKKAIKATNWYSKPSSKVCDSSSMNTQKSMHSFDQTNMRFYNY